MILQSVTHYIDTNTLEAAWVEPMLDENGDLVKYERVKCRSYSSGERDEFITDTGAPQYADMVGW